MRYGLAAVVVMAICGCAVAQEQPTTHPAGHFPFLQVDARERMIEVECEALDCKNPLEFFLCSTGTNEHEAVLRSKVKPSHLHAALLMLGLKPGEPVHFSEAKKAWLPPHGPPLHLIVRYQRDGKTIQQPAYRLMRDIKSKQEMPSLTWIFAGSRMMDNGVYAADQTGYLVSVVNFDLTVIDIPKLASSANETLEWETNPDRMPPAGTPVTLIITPAGGVEAPTTQMSRSDAPIDGQVVKIDAQGNFKLDGTPMDSIPALIAQLQKRDAGAPAVRVAIANEIEDNSTARILINEFSRVGIRFITIPQAEAAPASATTKPDFGADDALIRKLREKWEQSVAPRDAALREAARTHAEVIAGLRGEQQRLIDEADKIQRLIDQLEKRYQDMTTPP